jgi:hypothetical protein
MNESNVPVIGSSDKKVLKYVIESPVSMLFWPGQLSEIMYCSLTVSDAW